MIRSWLLVVGVFAALGNAGMVSGPKLAPPVADSLPSSPGPIVVGKKGIVVSGDTLIYTITWGPGARATSYDVTRSVASTNGVWAVVADSQSGGAKSVGSVPFPNTFSYTRTTLSHRMWIAAIPWDSATFTVSIASRNSVGVSAAVSVSWKVARKPGPPGPITIDSSLIVIGLLTRPSTASIVLGDSRIFCAFQQFGDGAVAQWTVTKPSCDSIYVAYVPLAQRQKVRAPQQAHTDSLSKTCVTWASPDVQLGVTQLGTCWPAARVTGLGLSARFPADALRYAVKL